MSLTVRLRDRVATRGWLERIPAVLAAAGSVVVVALAYGVFADRPAIEADLSTYLLPGRALLEGGGSLYVDYFDIKPPLTYALLVPIFFVSIGLKTDVRALAAGDLLLVAVLVVVAVISKLLGSGLGARVGGFTNRESVRVGVGMISRGEVGLIVANVGVSAALIRTELFSAVTIIVLLTTLITPPLLRLAYANKEPQDA